MNISALFSGAYNKAYYIASNIPTFLGKPVKWLNDFRSDLGNYIRALQITDAALKILETTGRYVPSPTLLKIVGTSIDISFFVNCLKLPHTIFYSVNSDSVKRSKIFHDLNTAIQSQLQSLAQPPQPQQSDQVVIQVQPQALDTSALTSDILAILLQKGQSYQKETFRMLVQDILNGLAGNWDAIQNGQPVHQGANFVNWCGTKEPSLAKLCEFYSKEKYIKLDLQSLLAVQRLLADLKAIHTNSWNGTIPTMGELAEQYENQLDIEGSKLLEKLTSNPNSKNPPADLGALANQLNQLAGINLTGYQPQQGLPQPLSIETSFSNTIVTAAFSCVDILCLPFYLGEWKAVKTFGEISQQIGTAMGGFLLSAHVWNIGRSVYTIRKDNQPQNRSHAKYQLAESAFEAGYNSLGLLKCLGVLQCSETAILVVKIVAKVIGCFQKPAPVFAV